MKDFGPITVAQVGRVAHAMLHWRAPLGSADIGVLEHLPALVDWLEDDHPCDVIVFRADDRPRGEVAVRPPSIDYCNAWEKLLVRIDRLPCISIVALDGPCIRLWLQLALACDHRVATTRSSFQVCEVKEGYLPGMNIFRLAKYIGIGSARRLAFTGALLEGAAAAALGIVDELCKPEELERALTSFLQRLEPIHPIAAQLARRLLNESFSTAFEQFLGQYLAAQHRCFASLPEHSQIVFK